MPKKTLGLYIHIPFCKTICVYCNFLTFANKQQWIPKYIDALKEEIIKKSSQFHDYIIETIYFGGGTPSLIEANQIDQVLLSIRENFQVRKSVEINIECNPESLDLEKIKHYRKSGVSRISLGVQSLNPKTLWKIARPHDDKAVLKALRALTSSKWKNFGCDIIMGLPYQTVDEFKEHLETILTYKPNHLSAYFLSYDTKRIDTFIKDSPGENIQIEMYWHLQDRLKKAGFRHYEVSNYAKKGFESKHNLRYWHQKEYLGLGLGAHSYYDNKVTENTRKLDLYLGNPIELEDSYTLDRDTQRMDYIMLRLRSSEGIDLKEFKKKFGQEETETLIKKAKRLQQPTQLFINSKKISLSNEGMLFADQIYQRLI